MKYFFSVVSFLCLSVLLPPGGKVMAQSQEPVVAQPQLTFELERRRFYHEGADLSTTSPMRLEATEETLRERGYTSGHRDEDTGLAYIRRRSRVDVRLTPEGDMLYLEQLPDGVTRDYSDQLNQLSIPLGAEPNKAVNPLMSLHPHTMINPEFEIVRELHEPDILSRDEQEGLEVIHTPQWVYRIHSDPETDQVWGIEQFTGREGILFRETRFDDWEESPSGRDLPRTVRTRTFFEGRTPYVELIFRNITENTLPEFRGNPADFPGRDP